MKTHASNISQELGLKDAQVRATIELLDRKHTVPFIARYRKEITENLDEVAITSIKDRLARLRDLDERRESVLRSLEKRELLTEALQKRIDNASTLSVLEDIYLPYKPKRRTRAIIARERGLESLAKKIFDQGDLDPIKEATSFVCSEKGINSIEDVLAGSRDIIAEWVNEDSDARSLMRDLFKFQGTLTAKATKGKELTGTKYEDYADWSEPLSKAPSHRIMAMMRGEKEGFLRLHIEPPEKKSSKILESIFIKGDGLASEQVKLACNDGYKRLLAPSMERECLSWARSRAEKKAILVFAENLRQLLLEPPLGQKRVLAIDPGFRSGCKIIALDRNGDLLCAETIYPHPPQERAKESAQKVKDLCERLDIEFIAVGNGTAGRKTEEFLRKSEIYKDVPVVMVDESGASVYSASKSARSEFPDQDVTTRGSISIGRRLMDPLAELVKIDPKSIGVGQYQHDVDETKLKNKLEEVVESSVNSVGANLNTASKELLTHVSGLGPKLAELIVKYREEHGPFRSREELKNVPRLGPKAFLQSAGFLRIANADNPLDSSAVHPESYWIVEAMAQDLNISIQELVEDKTLQKRIKPDKYVTKKTGMPTLKDILLELAQPGRDPRQKFEPFRFSKDATGIEDLRPGMKLPGIVTNITAFGAFVDVGVHQDGLVHISELSEKFIRDPTEVVKVHQPIEVTVLSTDPKRKRISLSMKENPEINSDES